MGIQCVCVPVTIENGKLLRFQRKAKSKAAPSPFFYPMLRWCLCGCCFMSVTYVTSGLLDHLPQLGREISGGVIKNNPTLKQPRPPDSHMGSWVGWVETGRILSLLQVHKDRFQREGVFQSCKTCGKSLKEAKID